MEDERLFRLAVEALLVTAHRDAYGRWSVVVRARRGDETWEETTSTAFELLTTGELLDALTGTLEAALGG